MTGEAGTVGDRRLGRGPGGTPIESRVDPWVVAIATVLVALVVAGTWRFGPALYQLGIHALTAGRALLRGETMVESRGEVFAQWPPLHAFVLAAGEALGLGWRATGTATNAASAAVVVVYSARTLAHLSGSRWLGRLLAAALVLSPRLYEGMLTLGSEPIFMALCALAVWHAVRAAGEPRTLWLALAASETALACLQRYVGVLLVAAIAAVLLLTGTKAARLRRCAWFCAASLAPLVLWIARNLWLTGTPTGERPPNDAGWGENVAATWRVLRGWIAPARGVAWLDLAFGFAALACGIAGLARALPIGRDRERAKSVALAAAFPLVYVGSLVTVASIVWLDELDDRLLLPALPGLLGLLLLGARELAERAAGAHALAVAILSLALGAAFAPGLREMDFALRRGLRDGPGGCGTREAAESELIAWLAAHPLAGPVFSNVPERAAFARGRATRPLPTDYPEDGRPPRVQFEVIGDGDLPCHVVWAQRNDKPPLRTKAVADRLRFELVVDLADAVVWRVERARP